MADKDQVSVCLTSEEFDRLVAFETQYNKKVEQHKNELAKANEVREREANELTEALEKSYAQTNALESELATVKANILDIEKAHTNSQQKNQVMIKQLKNEIKTLHDNIAKITKQKLDSETEKAKLLKENTVLNAEMKQLNNSVLQSVKDKSIIEGQKMELQMHTRNLEEDIRKLSKSLKQSSSIPNNKDNFSKELKQQQDKSNALLKEKNEVESKLKIVQLRMENKEEFVCNYYQTIKDKLSQFDPSEVKDIVNNDIDDFIRYLTTKKTVGFKK